MANRFFDYQKETLPKKKFQILKEKDIYNNTFYLNPLFLTVFKRYTDLLDIVVESKKSKRGRKKIYENNLYFLQCLNKINQTGTPWNKLDFKVSYSTIYRKFQLWTTHNVYKNVYKFILNFYIKNQFISYKELHNLYIDASHIKNVNGSEKIGKNHYDRFFNGTKLSLIVTENKIPIGLAYDGSNVSDITLVESTINNFLVKIKDCIIFGDKGYNSSKLEKKLKNEKNIKLVSIQKNKRRTNKEIKNNVKKIHKKNNFNKKEKYLFLTRYKIENFFSRVKSCKKIRMRYEKKINTYISFVYLYFSTYLSNIYKKKEITDKMYISIERCFKKMLKDNTLFEK